MSAEHEDLQNQSNCVECGQSFPSDETIQYGDSTICATCKPVFFQKLKESGQIGTMVYGGFWIRFGAKFIDWIITGVASMGFNFAILFIFSSAAVDGNILSPVQIISILFQYIIPIAYTTFFLGKFAATPGKMVCGLKVVIADGGKVSYLRALGRHFAEILSGIILMIGYIMAAFDNEKRTLHDRICNTRVIKK